MSAHEIAEVVLALPEVERLELARRIVATVVEEQEQADEIAKAVHGIEDVITGRVRGLNEAEFRHALE